ncbi:MAG: HAMP domain-containing sensor histidine kinase [Bacteroidota bacterium]
MNLRLNTIRSRIFLGFIFLTLTIIVLSSISYSYLRKTEEERKLIEEVSSLRLHTFNLIKSDLDFLNFESINQDFYEDGQSPVLDKRDSLYNFLVSALHEANDGVLKDYPFMRQQILETDTLLFLYGSMFREIKEKIIKRGFKDYGLEGRMRDYAHALEKEYLEHVSLADVLTLRRHEKDYFLRNEDVYIQELNNRSNEIVKNLEKRDNSDCHDAALLIRQYTETFNELAHLEREIGLFSNTGLRGEINNLSNVLIWQFDILAQTADARASEIIEKGKFTYTFTVVFSVFLSLALSYLIAYKLSKPIKRLSQAMNKFNTAKKIDESDLEESKGASEINNLSHSFFGLIKQVKNQFNEIEEKTALLEKQNGELTRLNDELDRFLYSAAHDLRSPIASMQGLINIAKQDINDPNHEHYFAMMHNSVSRLETFIKDIVDYTKNHKQTLDIEKVNVKSIFDVVLRDYQFMKGTELIDITYEETASVAFYSDSGRINIVLSNLVSNAIRYSDPDKHNPYVRIKTDITPEKAILSISDNGIGIKEEYQEKIFKMFFRATESSHGSGLGLFIVLQTLKVLGDNIKVQSSENVGTEFVIEIPNLDRSKGRSREKELTALT